MSVEMMWKALALQGFPLHPLHRHSQVRFPGRRTDAVFLSEVLFDPLPTTFYIVNVDLDSFVSVNVHIFVCKVCLVARC